MWHSVHGMACIISVQVAQIYVCSILFKFFTRFYYKKGTKAAQDGMVSSASSGFRRTILAEGTCLTPQMPQTFCKIYSFLDILTMFKFSFEGFKYYLTE
jgi:hypothetical protein